MRLVNRYLTIALVSTLLTTIAIAGPTNPDKPNIVKAGIATTFTQQFYETYRDEFMEFFEKNMHDIKIPDRSPEFTVGVFKVIF